MKKINNKGITLIELIVSFAIVGVAIIYFFQTLYTVKKVYNTARNETNNYVAVNYAFRIFDAALDNGIDIDTFKSKFGIDVEAVDTSSNLQHYKLTINGTKKDFYKYVTNFSSGTTGGSQVINEITSKEELNKYLSDAYKTECNECILSDNKVTLSHNEDSDIPSELKLDFSDKNIVSIKLITYPNNPGNLIQYKNACSLKTNDEKDEYFGEKKAELTYKNINSIIIKNYHKNASCIIEFELMEVKE